MDRVRESLVVLQVVQIVQAIAIGWLILEMRRIRHEFDITSIIG